MAATGRPPARARRSGPCRARRRAHRGAARAPLGHGHELACRQPRRGAAATRGRRGLGGAGRRVRAARARGRRGRRARAAQPPRHEALHERGARTSAGRGRGDRADLVDRGARRRHRDLRARAKRRVHVQPPVRGRARLPDREARSAPSSGRSRTCRTPSPPSSTCRRAPSRHPPASCSSRAAAASPGSPPRARSRSARPRTSRPPATRWSTCCTARASRSAADDALVVLDGGGPASERLGIVADASRRPRRPRPPLPARCPRRGALGVRAHDDRAAHRARGRRAASAPNPDSFGRDLPGRAEVWSTVTL